MARKFGGGLTLGLAVVIAFGSYWYGNPLERFMEAGKPAYYQARIAYIRGGPPVRQAIGHAFIDRKITMHDYSAIVFPAFIRVINSGESLLPPEDAAATMEQLRDSLAHTIAGNP